MKIERRYFDEIDWEIIDETKARKYIMKFYAKWKPIREELEAGRTVHTSFAVYRRSNQKGKS